MRVIIKENGENAAKWAADYVAYKINHFKPTKGRAFVLGLPTGSSPLGMYAELIKLYKAGKVSFENVITFNMDEYVGLEPTHPQKLSLFYAGKLFKYVNIKPQNIHLLNGMTKDFAKECREYERAMRNAGGVHLFVGGVGVDGHIAFNEPFSSLESRTRVKTLTESTIKANSRFFDNDLSKVPTMALTVGVGTIMDAEEVMIIATGASKAAALKHGIEGSLSHVWTISALQKHRHGIIVCDKEAVRELSTETVDYFTDIEKNNY